MELLEAFIMDTDVLPYTLARTICVVSVLQYNRCSGKVTSRPEILIISGPKSCKGARSGIDPEAFEFVSCMYVPCQC
jgi:hypothetical protein